MTAPVDADLNPFAVAVAVAGLLLGPKLAYYVGAYGLILLGWFTGLLVGLWRREEASKMPIWAYIACTLTGSLGVTVPAAEWATQYLPFSLSALLFPVAFIIPAVPDKWSTVGAEIYRRWKREREDPR